MFKILFFKCLNKTNNMYNYEECIIVFKLFISSYK